MRLSRLQKRILTELANYTVSQEASPNGHDWHTWTLSNRDLLAKCATYWGMPWSRLCRNQRIFSAKASFSRSLHRLYDKGLVVALVLAWVLVAKERGREFEEIFAWKGGGKDGRGWDMPRFSLVGLTDKGWEVAKALDESVQELELAYSGSPGSRT